MFKNSQNIFKNKTIFTHNHSIFVHKNQCLPSANTVMKCNIDDSHVFTCSKRFSKNFSNPVDKGFSTCL